MSESNVSGAVEQAAGPRRPDSRRKTLAVAGALALVLTITAAVLPAPYVVDSPGPSINTIGKYNDRQLIEVSGHQTYPTSGELDLTTVYLSGGPGRSLNFFEVLAAWVDPVRDVVPEELVYPRGTTGDAVEQQSEQAMVSSQESAVSAALGELEIPFQQELQVQGFDDDSSAAQSLQTGDVLRTVNGKAITDVGVLRDELQASAGVPVSVEIDRAGVSSTVPLTGRKSQDGQYQLGIFLATKFTFPFEVKIQLDNVVGPSAGLMFALGIVDTLTPGEMTGGRHFAGTGSIDEDGTVGAIGGIAQKLHGARSQGAEFFLAPAENCADVAGRIPDGLTVIKVATLGEAVAALQTISGGGDTAALPGCGS